MSISSIYYTILSKIEKNVEVKISYQCLCVGISRPQKLLRIFGKVKIRATYCINTLTPGFANTYPTMPPGIGADNEHTSYFSVDFLIYRLTPFLQLYFCKILYDWMCDMKTKEDTIAFDRFKKFPKDQLTELLQNYPNKPNCFIIVVRSKT